jgi:DNA-binding transcriptional regulator YiaG
MLGLEVSRLARNNADWHRLLEICAMTGTLICDEDGLYDPGDFNDRLLLGLKGTMSEAELHFIRARLQGEILSKARRGELQTPLPVGLSYDPAGNVTLNPDGAVRHALEQWTALIPDAHPGYLTFEQFEINQRLLAENANAHAEDRAGGPAREGPALLQGLAICGNCGKRMTIRYHQRRGTLVPDYQCVGDNIQRHTPTCQVIPGHGVDEAISALLLDTVTPLALEVALSVQAELETRAGEADQLRRSHVERARHHADLARRRYLAVDPDNRLVADTLEGDWNDKLRGLQAAQDEYERASAAAHTQLTEQQQAQIRQLAADFPKLWSDPSTPQRERKRITRLLIEDVTLNRDRTIHLHVRFRGGQTQSLTIPIPLRAWEARRTHPDTIALLDKLLDTHTDAETANELNHAGHQTGTDQAFTSKIVVHLRRSHNLPSHTDRLRAQGLLTLTETAERLGVHTSTIKTWRHAGLLTSHAANDKNEQLYDPPDPTDPALTSHLGHRLRNRTPSTQPTQRGAL